jgi:hypothetical protein
MADMKMRMCLIGGIIILLIVIIVPAGMYSNLQDNNATNHSNCSRRYTQVKEWRQRRHDKWKA